MGRIFINGDKTLVDSHSAILAKANDPHSHYPEVSDFKLFNAIKYLFKIISLVYNLEIPEGQLADGSNSVNIGSGPLSFST